MLSIAPSAVIGAREPGRPAQPRGLRVDPRDEALVSEIARRARPRVEVSAQLEALGGIEAASADGRSVRNTLEERMANAEPALRILFGEIWSRDARDAPGPPGGAALEVVP